MARIVDRRLNGKNKSAVNRQRFIKRFRGQIKKAVADAIAGRSIVDIEKGETVSIPTKDISEPVFGHGSGGSRQYIHPGNKEFQTGDKISRPKKQGGGGGGGKASNDGEGMDNFAFELSREEFLEFFFEDLALPNLVKTKLAAIKEFKSVRAGYTSDGVPANINIVRSLRGAIGRRIALSSPYREQRNQAQLELEELSTTGMEHSDRAQALRDEIEFLEKKIKAIPFIDTFDLRFNNRVLHPKPTTQAVMFCVMDISGSMGQDKKDIAKRFFMLLYLFLTRTYEKIQLVFIAHHTIAKEVDEEEFFYSRETGGTVVSSALKLMQEVIHDRYPADEWNIYAAQASDGDDWNDDPVICRKILTESILPFVQYYAYIEITKDRPQSLWREYINVKTEAPNFEMQRIEDASNIYPVFRELFKKQLA